MHPPFIKLLHVLASSFMWTLCPPHRPNELGQDSRLISEMRTITPGWVLQAGPALKKPSPTDWTLSWLTRDKYGDYYLDTTCREANMIIISVSPQNPLVSTGVKRYHFNLICKRGKWRGAVTVARAESTPAANIRVGGSRWFGCHHISKLFSEKEIWLLCASKRSSGWKH